MSDDVVRLDASFLMAVNAGRRKADRIMLLVSFLWSV